MVGFKGWTVSEWKSSQRLKKISETFRKSEELLFKTNFKKNDKKVSLLAQDFCPNLDIQFYWLHVRDIFRQLSVLGVKLQYNNITI